MPFDDREFPASFPSSHEVARLRRDRRLVAGWLFACAGMIFVMVVLGGATRLTGSGLSIMEWAPLSGVIPPLTEREWQRLYALYQQIPQYSLVNQGFGIAGFKHIFWLEWTHRLWGRLIGVVFLVPLVVLAWRGAIRARLVPRLVGLFVLGGLQGAVGWFMVASGFLPDTVAVSAYRLVAHLTLALVLYAAILWTALSVLRPAAPRLSQACGLRRLSLLSVSLVAVTIVAGGFTAGLHAGLAYNTFPLMDGRVVPEGWAALSPVWRNVTENVAAVQFDHRLLATLSALCVLATLVVGLRTALPREFRVAVLAFGAAVVTQYALGVVTLVWAVPVPVAVLHQTGAALLLTAGLVLVHALRGAKG